MVNYPEHGVEIVGCPHGHMRYDHDQGREKDAGSENMVFDLRYFSYIEAFNALY